MKTKLIYLSALLLLSFSCQELQKETEEKTEPAKVEEPTSELFKTIAKMDSLYFSAQNACDLERYAYYLSDDFEFFHDVAGLTVSKEKEMADMAIFCGEE